MGGEGAAVASQFNALAVTIGSDIFAAQPLSPRVLAHELHHVTQWQQGRTGLVDNPGGLRRANRDDPLEREARSGQFGQARSQATVFAWDDPNDGFVRPGPEELEEAIGISQPGVIRPYQAVEILQSNQSTMRALKERVGSQFFPKLHSTLRAHGLWPRVRPYVEDVLTLGERILTYSSGVSVDEDGLYRLLERVSPVEARGYMQQQGGYGDESTWTSVQGALRETLAGWTDSRDEYERAIGILQDRAGLAPSSGDLGDQAYSQARVDIAFERMRQGFEGGWISSTPSRALLAAAELSAPERQALLPRVQLQTMWGLHHIDGWNALQRVLGIQSDGFALRYALHRSIQLDGDGIDALGLERAVRHGARLLSDTPSDGQAIQAQLHEPVFLAALAGRADWRHQMEALGVPAATRLGFEIRKAESTAALLDALSRYDQADRVALMFDDALARQIRVLETSSDAQAEALAALLPTVCEVPSEDRATPVARRAAWQMLRSYEQGNRARIFAVLRMLPEQDRVSLPRSASYSEMGRRMRSRPITQSDDSLFFDQLDDVVRGERQGGIEALRFGTEFQVIHSNHIIGVQDPRVLEEYLGEEYAGRHAVVRQAFVDFNNVPESEWPTLSQERRLALADYASWRPILSPEGDRDETRMLDVLFDAPQLVEGAAGPANPAMEADYLYHRLMGRAGVRSSVDLVNDWSGAALDEATERFRLRYDQVRLGGVTQAELADLYLLYQQAMRRTTEHLDASEGAAATVASVVGAAVGVAVVTVFSGGTLGPVAIAALAGTLGGTAAMGAGAAVRAENTSETLATDFGSGFVEGALAAALEPLLAGSAIIRGSGALTAGAAGRMGMGAGARAGLARGTQVAVSSVIEGAVGGAVSELYLTASDEATWNGAVTEVLARLLSAVGRGAAFGGVGGLVGAGVVGGLGAAWGQMAGRHGASAVRETVAAFDDLALGGVERLGRLSDEHVEALFQARRMALAGDGDGATALIVANDLVPTSQVDELLETIVTRRRAIEEAAAQAGRPIDSPALAQRFGLDEVVVDPRLGSAIEIHYGLSLDGSLRLQLRVGDMADMGDALLHGDAIAALRAWGEETRSIRGLFERVRAWARGGTLSNADEVVLELQKHARMIEARERALAGLAPDSVGARRIRDEIEGLRAAADEFEIRLRGMGTPEGVIASGRGAPDHAAQIDAAFDLDEAVVDFGQAPSGYHFSGDPPGLRRRPGNVARGYPEIHVRRLPSPPRYIVGEVTGPGEHLVGRSSASGLALDRVPTVDGFPDWYRGLTTAEFAEVWADPYMRDFIESRLRHPGGFHEWYMVSRADRFHEWGVPVEEIWSFRSRIDRLEWIDPNTGVRGRHGADGSGTFHRELSDLIDRAGSLEELNASLVGLGHRWSIPNIPTPIRR